jgi:aspartyl-tRNA(Asn)/glutamyl-tRNA(Gln) amidotransferase subunit A
MVRQNIKELNKKFIQKDLTPTKLYQECLQRIDQVEDDLNAFVSVTPEVGLNQAKESEARYRSDKSLSHLDGLPVGIKDVFCTKDIRTTAASKMLDNFVPPLDAMVVKKLKEAGAVIVGKNNCDAWAHGASTEHSDYGVAKNPWDLTRVSGGSSGGSAAAVAAGECLYSIGSDTGGSIRQPAAFCGVVGLKPTYGRVSRYGLIAMGSSLDCVGPIANSTLDIAAILEVIAGYDEKDSTTVDIPVPKYSEKLGNSIAGKKIGWVKEFFQMGLADEIKKTLEDARGVFEKLGAKFVEVSLPHVKYSIPVYYIIQPAEVSSNLGRYDGIKYGYSAKGSQSLIDHYFKSRDEGFGAEAKRRIMLGTFVLSAGYYDAYYSKAMKVRTLIKKDFDQALEKVDCLLAPVTPTTAFKLGEKTKSPLQMYLADVFTAPVNLAGHPALSLPSGFDKDKLPIGMQIIGKYFDEEAILNFGHLFEESTKEEKWRDYTTAV